MLSKYLNAFSYDTTEPIRSNVPQESSDNLHTDNFFEQFLNDVSKRETSVTPSLQPEPNDSAPITGIPIENVPDVPAVNPEVTTDLPVTSKPGAMPSQSTMPSANKSALPEITKHTLPANLPHTDVAYQSVVPNSKKAYRIVNDSGETQTVMLSKIKDAERLLSDDGYEYLLKKIPDSDTYRVANKQRVSGVSSIITPSAGSFVVAAPYADFEKSRQLLEQNGLEVVAIMGSGPIGDAAEHTKNTPFSNGTKVQAGYQYLNLKRLNPNSTAPVVKNDTLLQQDIGVRRGTYSTVNGKTHQLDFTDLDTLPAKTRIQQRNQRLKALEQREDVVAISLDAWSAGNVSGQGRDTMPLARSFRVFDKQGEFLGHVKTPAIGLKDAETVARDLYGDKFGSLDNLDGDFYAKTWVKGSSDPDSTELAKGLNFGSLLVRPKTSGRETDTTSTTTDSTTQPTDTSKINTEFENEKKKNQVTKLWEYAKRGEFNAIWRKLTNS